MKVPFLIRCPEIFSGSKTMEPTILAAAGIEKPAHFKGQSILPLLQAKEVNWRDKILYEYYWEHDYPQTPTMHGVRTDRYKLIRYYGIWDTNEL